MYTTTEIREIVESEGLDRAILQYINPKSVAHPTLAALWDTARDILTDIEEFMDIHSNDIDIDDPELYNADNDDIADYD